MILNFARTKLLLISVLFFQALCLISISGCSTHVYVANEHAEVRKFRVAVLPFRSPTGHPEVGLLASEAVANALVSRAGYLVVERSMLEEILKEQRLSSTGAIDDATAVRIGKLLGAEGIVVGSVDEFQERLFFVFPPSKVAIQVRLINVETGAVEWAADSLSGGGKYFASMMLPIWNIYGFLASPSAKERLVSVATSVCGKISREVSAH